MDWVLLVLAWVVLVVAHGVRYMRTVLGPIGGMIVGCSFVAVVGKGVLGFWGNKVGAKQVVQNLGSWEA